MNTRSYYRFKRMILQSENLRGNDEVSFSKNSCEKTFKRDTPGHKLRLLTTPPQRLINNLWTLRLLSSVMLRHVVC